MRIFRMNDGVCGVLFMVYVLVIQERKKSRERGTFLLKDMHGACRDPDVYA